MFAIKKEKRAFRFALVLGLAASVILAGQARGEKKKEDVKEEKGAPAAPVATAPVTVSKSVMGEVEIIRNDYLTIVYGQDKKQDGTIAKDYEMVFPLDEAIILIHLNKIDELNEGDRIDVQYAETSWIDEKGVGRMERKIEQIRFVSPAIKGYRSQ